MIAMFPLAINDLPITQSVASAAGGTAPGRVRAEELGGISLNLLQCDGLEHHGQFQQIRARVRRRGCRNGMLPGQTTARIIELWLRCRVRTTA